ncbi:MAG TPA: hypothetical protein VLJ58_22320 [Ramlibacter sp.]|nr:hypothetical protein [Ramlibacter sp.]
MNRIISLKSLAAAGLAFGALAAASVAHARSDVFFSIGLQAPGVYVEPAPVYVQPQPVYVQPQPVYVQPRPVYVQPQPVYTPAPVYYSQGWERRGNFRHGHGNGHRYGPNGDLDRDGIRNQHDRDIDGDGVRNRHDQAPANPRYR